MSIQAGLVGLPNVGKSTLFNALTKSSVPAENYPFCTIEPHTAITPVADIRAVQLSKVYNSKKIVPATATFVDIAGLVQGAASGAGLGNQFLSHVQQVHLILHVLRCFIDPDIIATQNEIDPVADYEVIVAELMLKDLESVVKRLEKMDRLIKAAQNNAIEKTQLQAELQLLQTVRAALEKADADAVRKAVQHACVVTIPLLCAKNALIIANVGQEEIEDDAYKKNPHYQALVHKFGTEKIIPVCAKVAFELSQLPADEAQELMGLLGMKEKSLDAIIRATYTNLGLITFFTCGPQETHCWPIKKGMNIRKAGGEIHSDLERGFICAEVFNYQDILQYGSEAKAKEAGKLRIEGQDYIVQDGDVIHIRFNV